MPRAYSPRLTTVTLISEVKSLPWVTRVHTIAPRRDGSRGTMLRVYSEPTQIGQTEEYADMTLPEARAMVADQKAQTLRESAAVLDGVSPKAAADLREFAEDAEEGGLTADQTNEIERDLIGLAEKWDRLRAHNWKVYGEAERALRDPDWAGKSRTQLQQDAYTANLLAQYAKDAYMDLKELAVKVSRAGEVR